MRGVRLKGSKPSKKHHWWPVALQSHWDDHNGNVCWIEPDGKIGKVKSANRKIGLKFHGHTIFQGTQFVTNFESEFDIDDKIHSVIKSLQALKPIGTSVSDFAYLIKKLFKRDRDLRDICRFYDLDQELHRDLLLLIMSLLIRSPANRFRYESYPGLIGLPPNEEVGKMNMMNAYRSAKDTCLYGSLSNQYFVILRAGFGNFICGDGALDWLSANVNGRSLNGRALIPLTPRICIYFCTPMSMRSSPNCAVLNAAPWMVDWINDITQTYSKDQLFYRYQRPKLTEAFKRGEFLAHGKRSDALLDMLDELAGIPRSNPYQISGVRW